MNQLTQHLTSSISTNIYTWFSQAGSANCIQKLSDNSVLNIANEVNSIFADVKLDDLSVKISLPRLVVVGTQSSGKSSVLNRIIGMDILPTGSNMVTRTPLELRLHKTNSSNTANKSTGRIEAGYYTTTGQWAVDCTIEISTPTPTPEQISSISAYIKNRTVQLAGKGMDVSDKPIILEVYSYYVPNLSLIDLPGLTLIAREDKDQPVDIQKRIEDLVVNYIKDDRTIILTVIQARTDIETDLGLALVKRHDRAGKRTVGVLTKPDLMNQGTNIGEYLSGVNISKNLALTYGYYTVNNCTDELTYFANHSEYSKEVYKPRIGLINLTDNLCKILVSSINDLLPAVTTEISKLEEKIHKKLEIYGEGVPSGSSSKVHLLNRYVSDFTNCFLDSVESRGLNINTGKQIKDILIAYREEINKIKPFTNGNIYTKKYFDSIVSSFEGNHMTCNSSPIKILNACITDGKTRPLLHMSKPTVNTIDKLHNVLINTVKEILLEDQFSKYPQLTVCITGLINDNLMTPAKQVTCNKSLESLLDEEAYVWTDNPNFKNSLKRLSTTDNDVNLQELVNLLNSYYSSVTEVIGHSVPKLIMRNMVRYTEDNLHSFLIKNICNESKIGLLQEDSEVEQQRKYYCNLRDKIASVKKSLC